MSAKMFDFEAYRERRKKEEEAAVNRIIYRHILASIEHLKNDPLEPSAGQKGEKGKDERERAEDVGHD
jgi:hypothetical protein